MRNSLRTLAAVCLAIAGMASSAHAAEMVDNPAFVAWSKAKVGTSITYTMEMAMTMEGAPAMNNGGTVTQTLKEATADSVTLDVTTKMSMNGQAIPEQKSTQKIPAKVEKGKEWAGPEAKGEISDMKTGKDTVDVAGKKIDTETREFTMKMTEPMASTTQTKMWTSADVPGGMVKMQTKSETPMKMTMTMTLTDIKQP